MNASRPGENIRSPERGQRSEKRSEESRPSGLSWVISLPFRRHVCERRSLPSRSEESRLGALALKRVFEHKTAEIRTRLPKGIEKQCFVDSAQAIVVGDEGRAVRNKLNGRREIPRY